ncbi:MAG: SAM-dependent methyltransferase [Lentisphaerae bacterium]|nr:SAM-dependent methyltransferase [Lentisphaerota bacterium]
MKIQEDAINILLNSMIEDCQLFLPPEQLERKLYLSANKVLEAIGGKWNRKAKAHIFNKPPGEILDEILLTGEYTDAKKEFQFFETPEPLARQLVSMANIQEGETVLEPSAGKGAIASFLPGCHCIELNKDNQNYLVDNGFMVVGGDFMESGGFYDVIIANPPFTKQQDIDHINHMLDLAHRCVVSVASAGVMFRDNKKTVAFRDRIQDLGGTITPLPDKTFASSGTDVRSCIVFVDNIRNLQ